MLYICSLFVVANNVLNVILVPQDEVCDCLWFECFKQGKRFFSLYFMFHACTKYVHIKVLKHLNTLVLFQNPLRCISVSECFKVSTIIPTHQYFDFSEKTLLTIILTQQYSNLLF